MPEIISLNAEPRLRAGKGAARATRRSGRVPGIVYGDKKEPVLISLELRALARVVAKPGFFATLIDISVDGTTHRTLPRDVQYHPISDAPLHVAHGQRTLVVQDFQHPELRRAQSEAGDARAGMMVHGIERACQDDPELQGDVVRLRR